VTAGALDFVAGGAVVLAAIVADVADVADVGEEGAGRGAGGASGEHAVTTRASATHAAVFRPIRPAWQKRPVSAQTTRSSDTVLGPLGLG